jgi:hypothetical protein
MLNFLLFLILMVFCWPLAIVLYLVAAAEDLYQEPEV